MADLLPFRVHFQGDDVSPYDTDAASPVDARDRAKAARPGEIIRKVKRVRDAASLPAPQRAATRGARP